MLQLDLHVALCVEAYFWSLLISPQRCVSFYQLALQSVYFKIYSSPNKGNFIVNFHILVFYFYSFCPGDSEVTFFRLQKLLFTVSLLDVQCEDRSASSLVVSLGKALNVIASTFEWLNEKPWF